MRRVHGLGFALGLVVAITCVAPGCGGSTETGDGGMEGGGASGAGGSGGTRGGGGSAGSGGTSGVGSGGSSGVGSGGSSGVGSGGSSGVSGASGAGGASGTGSGGSSGSSGAGGSSGSAGAGGSSGTGIDAGVDSPFDAPPDVDGGTISDAPTCTSPADAGALFPAACVTCLETNCGSELTTCMCDPNCVAVIACFDGCLAKGGGTVTCATNCAIMGKGMSGGESVTLFECANSDCGGDGGACTPAHDAGPPPPLDGGPTIDGGAGSDSAPARDASADGAGSTEAGPG
jgi:hypothetical protein